jgi:hypothetical protein
MVPRVGFFLADVRGVRQVPEVVLDEPEDRIRDHVVEAVVGQGVALHQKHVVLDPVELDLHRLPARLAAHDQVLVGHRGGDPQRPAMSDQPAQGRNQAATAAPQRAAPVLIVVELRGTAIRHDDQPPIRHGLATKSR